ncbi:hypothetical protein GGQ22_16710 [Nocardioides sp. zg-579]|uniref:DUF7674 domain-containing protein n=1 Tax=Nocardioides marmotae TaxID=2663857 RepID=A0A6I3JEY8_9ACTN|nr:hypothetical protein [Nocardioides marmotae]MCR6033068.1 hypothetical protein [Gordonia jinghuaiqii]MTB96720.1 hypothetical protein [Nocardioides marmotae]QKE03069.1 hypothetical protein HPC71_19900 [Nocardioides marmotae]
MSDEYQAFIDAVLEAAPEVGDALRAQGEDTAPDLEIPVLWLGLVGRAVATCLPRMSPDVASRVFGTVEHHLAHGSESMSTAVATGFLESVAGAVSADRLAPDLLAGVLGPESRAYIDAWDQFTLGRSSLEGS